MSFNVHHRRGRITMSDGHVITADSPVNLMAHDLISSLYDKYAGASGMLRIHFSASAAGRALVLYALPCAPNIRDSLYEAIAAAIGQQMDKGSRVTIRTPAKQWVQIKSIESSDAPPAHCDVEVTEGDSVSINPEPLQTGCLRDFF